MSNIFFCNDSDLKNMNGRSFDLGTGVLLSVTILMVSPVASSIATAQSAQSNFTCNTDSYTAQIRWQGAQPQLTFGSSSASPNIRNTPVEVLSRRGIVTYTTQQSEAKTTVFVYSDGTCAVAIINTAGETTVNELGQVAEGDNANSSPNNTLGDTSDNVSDETLTSFQTNRNAVRIFTRSGETLMNVYDKQERITWLNGVPVKQEQTPEGTRYTNERGEARVEVFLDINGDRTLTINGDAEEGY